MDCLSFLSVHSWTEKEPPQSDAESRLLRALCTRTQLPYKRTRKSQLERDEAATKREKESFHIRIDSAVRTIADDVDVYERIAITLARMLHVNRESNTHLIRSMCDFDYSVIYSQHMFTTRTRDVKLIGHTVFGLPEITSRLMMFFVCVPDNCD